MKTAHLVIVLLLALLLGAISAKLNKCSLCKIGCKLLKKEADKQKCNIACNFLLCRDERPTIQADSDFSILRQIVDAVDDEEDVDPSDVDFDDEEEADSFETDCGEAYDDGWPIGRMRCVTIDGKPVVTSTAIAYNKMKKAAAAAGISLHLNSGFRTHAEQKRLYNCYLTKKCNNGNLAAEPGFSNHQNGLALDISVVSSKTYNWLTQNASKFGFVRTVSSEKWHWELRNTRCNAFVKYTCK